MTDISPELRQYAERMFAMQDEECWLRAERDDLALPASDFCLANWFADDPLGDDVMYDWYERGAKTALEYELVVENEELRADVERLQQSLRLQRREVGMPRAALAEERQRPAPKPAPKGKQRNRVVFHVAAKAAAVQRLRDEMVSQFFVEDATFKLTNISVVDDEVHAVIEYTVKGGHPADVEKRLDRMEKFVGPITDRKIEVVEREVL